ncbi:hypothetical protein LPJ66_001830 [Kickxella alabastrina]|uniref:Uncharacterized protein n=1 Tax=Kickxella alabastrina TaxID=61397 RepID=A0ACC1IS84_9FUNG|nr:hypothetical protein LPJ66_001830 [Kickxella alabastrina]
MLLLNGLHGQNLHAIVEMHNVYLTPENYECTSLQWQVDCSNLESIIATAVYFYNAENINSSELVFREFIGKCPEILDRSEQIRTLGLENTLYEQSYCTQRAGKVNIKDGRCICYPNVYQYQVTPQQKSWWAYEICSSGVLKRLPVGLQCMFFEFTDTHTTFEDAQ